MLDLLTILFILLALLGVGLFRRGWTGRRVDNHPWCRACRFDLRGRWPGAEKCPECGAVLDAVGAVEIGRRVHSPASLVFGVLLLVVCSAWLGAEVWKAAAPIDWMTYKPDWWIARDAKSVDVERAEGALKELNARIERDAISAARLSELIAYALELQADESATWREGWGDVVLQAWRKGSLTPDQIMQFAQRAVSLQMDVESPMVRRWEVTRAGPTPFLDRAGMGDLALQLRPLSATLDGIELDIHPEELASHDPLRSRNRMLPAKQFAVLVEPGERELQITWQAMLWPRKATAAPAVWDVPLTALLTILAPLPGTPELVVEDEITSSLRDCIVVEVVGIRAPAFQSRTPPVPRVVAVVTIRDAPIAASLQIDFCFSAGPSLPRQQSRLGINPGAPYQIRCHIDTGSTEEPDRISVMLRPLVERVPGLNLPREGHGRLWYGKPIEINDIAVQWFDTEDDPTLPQELRQLAKRPAGWGLMREALEQGTIRPSPNRPEDQP